MNKLLSLQYLRAIAALTVTVVHLKAPLARLGYDGWVPAAFGSGVDIFFVISGVVMWLSTAGHPDLTPREFLMRRIVRIVPLYWIMTSLVVLVMLVYPAAVNHGVIDPLHVLASMLFIPVAHPVETGQVYPVLIPGWTINAEMFFYAVFALALFLRPRMRIVAVAALFAVLVAGGLYAPPASTAFFYTRPLLLEFVAGLIIGRLFLADIRIHARAAALLLVAGLAGLVASAAFELALEGVDRALIWGVPAVLIVAGMLWLERADALLRLPALGFIGDASYSIYLTHTITLSACSFVLASVTGGLAPVTVEIIYVGLAFAATIVVGAACYLMLERPITRWLGRWRASRAEAGSRVKLATKPAAAQTTA